MIFVFGVDGVIFRLISLEELLLIGENLTKSIKQDQFSNFHIIINSFAIVAPTIPDSPIIVLFNVLNNFSRSLTSDDLINKFAKRRRKMSLEKSSQGRLGFFQYFHLWLKIHFRDAAEPQEILSEAYIENTRNCGQLHVPLILHLLLCCALLLLLCVRR